MRRVSGTGRLVGLAVVAALVPLPGWAQGPGAEGGEPALVPRIDAGARPFGVREAGTIPSGSVVSGAAGERLVLVSARRGRELWKVGGDGAVLETGYFVSTGVAGRIRVEWESSPAFEWRETAAGALPWKPTGERFDAFRLSDWLVAGKVAVALPFLGGENIGFRFGASGALTARAVGGERVTGAWWWSRGLLHAQLEGFEEVATYDWRLLAGHVGWNAGMSAPVAVGAAAPAPRRPGGAPPPRRPLPGAVAAVCHRDVLGALLRTAAERSDVVSALGIEKETLLLCGDRQKLVLEILEAEKRLAELIGQSVKPKPEVLPPPPVVRTVAQLVAAKPSAPKPPAAPAAGPAGGAPGDGGGKAEPPDAAPSGGASARRDAQPTPRKSVWRWFSMIGREGRLVAGVTDGSGAWFVAEGERVPGAGLVKRISARPPGVELAGVGALAWAARPPAPGERKRPEAGSPVREPGPEPIAEELPERVVERVFGAAGGGGRGRGTLKGRADTVDGDTLRMGEVRIRLWGIDAPEKDQACRAEGLEWSCGLLATAALRSRATNVSCREKGRDGYGRVLAVCFDNGEDVNAWMVAEGWALAYRRFATDYVDEEEAARKARKGMHRGEFIQPWHWRRGERYVRAAGEGSEGGAAGSGARPLPPLPRREVAR